MKKVKGFFLVETVVAFALLTFFMLLFGQFFTHVIYVYCRSQDRLKAFESIQNCIEQMWQGEKPTCSDQGKQVRVESWPIRTDLLPGLPNRNVKLVYETLSIYDAAEKCIICLPGYVCYEQK